MKEEAKQSEVINKEKENKIGEASGNMVNVLKNSTDSKHRNSQFLQFLQQLNHGAISIDDKTGELVEDKDKLVEFKKLEEARLQEEAEVRVAEEKFKE